jgi:hypothetical protein
MTTKGLKPFLLTLSLLLTTLQALSPQTPQQKFPRTYICLLTQPMAQLDHISYVSNSYVRFVEQTGAVALLVPWDLPWSEISAVLGQCNGLVLPGGATPLVEDGNAGKVPTFYMKKIDAVIRWATRQNLGGRFFSIWAVCLGFEELFLS